MITDRLSRFSIFYLLLALNQAHAAESVYAIGDSVVEGAQASAPTNRFVSILASGRDWTVRPLAFGSAGIADYALQAYPGFTRGVVASPNALQNGQHSLLLAGYNDMRDWGTNEAFQVHFQRTLGALVSWLAIPETQKIRAQSDAVQRNGSWTSSQVFGGALGLSSTNVGDNLKFQVNGPTLYLVYLSTSAPGNPYRKNISGYPTTNGPEFSIVVDGADYGVVDAHNAFGNRRAILGADLFEPELLDYAPHLLRVSGLSAGFHQVEVRVQSASLPATFLWAAGSAGFTNGIAGPDAWVGNTLSMLPEGYSQHSTQGSAEAVASFNESIAVVCTQLYSDGLNVVHIDASAAYSPATGGDPGLVQPSDVGHSQIAQAFLSRAQLRFGIESISATELRLFINARYGANYQVQRSAGLSNWTNMTEIEGGNQPAEWSVVVPFVEGGEFFRVLTGSAL